MKNETSKPDVNIKVELLVVENYKMRINSRKECA